MAKSLATDWVVSVNGVTLSDHAFDVQGADSKDRVDVSGFSATGTREYLPGLRDQTVTVSFIQDRASAKVDATIRPLYESGTSFPFFVKPTSGGSAQYGGTANVYSYPFSAVLNQREEVVIEFSPATNTGFAWS